MGVSVAEQDAVVTNLVGQLKAKDEQGNIRDVTIGDLIKNGEQLIFSPSSQFILQMADGTVLTEVNLAEPIPDSSLGAIPEITATPEFATAPVSADAEIAALQAQILAGDDPTAGLPETAAGTAAGGGGNEGGTDFVSLGRTGDETLAGAGHDTEGFDATADPAEDPLILTEEVANLPTLGSSTVTLLEANLPQGSNPTAASITQSGGLIVDAEAGIASLSVGGIDIFTGGLFVGPITITTANGLLTLTGFDPASGVLSYNFTFDSALDHSAADTISQTFTALVTDLVGNTTASTITVNIVDDSPTGVDDTNTVSENGEVSIPITGNVLLNDTQGADSAVVSQITSSDGTTLAVSGTTSISGSFGFLDISADGSYSYLLDNSLENIQALAEGEEVTEIFTYQLTDSDGDSVLVTLSITITGTNDVPIVVIEDPDGPDGPILADDEGLVIEAGNEDDGTIVPGVTNATGTLAAADVDNGAVLTWSGNSDGLFGSLTIDPATGEWSYNLDNSLADSLAEGASAEDIFFVTVTDEFGASTTQQITITVQGTNDSPVITSSSVDASGSVIEAGNEDNGTIIPGIVETSGTLTASDVDTGSILTWSFNPQISNFGIFSINSSTGEWTYTLDNQLADSLAEGQTSQETFLVTVTDEFGAIATQLVTVTVQGTNDIPTITSGDEANIGSVKEAGVIDDFDNNPDNNNTPAVAVLQTGGTVTADDVDNGASLSWSGDASGTYGEFTIDSVTGEWVYTLNNSDLVNALASGESHDEIFTVTVTDEFGATATQDITITVNGTNDIPVLTINDLNGYITEDDTEPNLNVVGVLSIADVDNSDSHSISYEAIGNVVWSGGTLTQDQIDAPILGFSADADSWDYTIANSLIQFLAENETITLSFDVTVTDFHGATDTETVTITITGNNDLVMGEFAKEVWVPASGDEILIPYEEGYPLNIAAPTDTDTNDILTITVTGIPEFGQVGYYDEFDVFHALTETMVITSEQLTSLVYIPNGDDLTHDMTLNLEIQSGTEVVNAEYIIHTVPPSSLPGHSVQIGDGSTPLTSGNDQEAQLVLIEQFANDILSDPLNGMLDLFTDFQKNPIDTPIPAGEIEGTQAGDKREAEVSISLTINGVLFIVLAAGDGNQDWFYDSDSGLMKASFNYTEIYQDGHIGDANYSLANYISSGTYTPTAGDIWDITYLDNDGGSWQARFLQANFVFDDEGDPSITVVGTDNIDNLIFGGTSGDSLTGANQDDRIFGREGNDTINGMAGDDELAGGAGDDIINGGIGNDFLIGGPGSDSLDGGVDTDVDTFIWDIGSDDGSTDTVYNFDSTYDILNLADILDGEDDNAVSLDEYLDFNFVGGNTEISVDADNDGDVDLTIIIDSVDLTNGGVLATDIDIINSLLAADALVVDTIP